MRVLEGGACGRGNRWDQYLSLEGATGQVVGGRGVGFGHTVLGTMGFPSSDTQRGYAAGAW